MVLNFWRGASCLHVVRVWLPRHNESRNRATCCQNWHHTSCTNMPVHTSCTNMPVHTSCTNTPVPVQWLPKQHVLLASPQIGGLMAPSLMSPGASPGLHLWRDGWRRPCSGAVRGGYLSYPDGCEQLFLSHWSWPRLEPSEARRSAFILSLSCWLVEGASFRFSDFCSRPLLTVSSARCWEFSNFPGLFSSQYVLIMKLTKATPNRHLVKVQVLK